VTLATHPISQPGKPPRATIALGRIANVVVDPIAAFAHVGTDPTSALAFLALVIVRFSSVVAFYRPELTPARLAAGILFQLITIWPLTLALTLLLWVTARAWGARTSWSSTYCVTVHVMLAYTLATVAIASASGALLPESANIDLRHPPFTNLGALADASANPVIHAILVELDYRTAYALALTFLGVRESTVDRDTPRTWLIVATCLAINFVVATLSTLAR
jgi:hypothetical protein